MVKLIVICAMDFIYVFFPVRILEKQTVAELLTIPLENPTRHFVATSNLDSRVAGGAPPKLVAQKKGQEKR